MFTVTRHFRWHWRWTVFLVGYNYEKYSSFKTLGIHLGPVGLVWSWGIYDV